jgi:peptidyl-prolyl isomerase G (cyclophilin G)
MSDGEDGSGADGRRRKHPSDSPEDRLRRRRKKFKHKKYRSPTTANDDDDLEGDKGPVAETETEYDARLEKEEIERREAARKKELERIRKQCVGEGQSTDSVRFKGLIPILFIFPVLTAILLGRGRMKYVDPEVHQRRPQ